MNPGGTWRVTVTDAVGVIAVGDLRLLVEPKIPRAHLFYLFGSSELFPRLDETSASAGPGTDLWELVARWLVQALERVIRRDLVRDYLPLRDTLEAARRTIDALATAQWYYQGSRVCLRLRGLRKQHAAESSTACSGVSCGCKHRANKQRAQASTCCCRADGGRWAAQARRPQSHTRSPHRSLSRCFVSCAQRVGERATHADAGRGRGLDVSYPNPGTRRGRCS